jgi:hypothetical protein
VVSREGFDRRELFRREGMGKVQEDHRRSPGEVARRNGSDGIGSSGVVGG